ncbi:MAG: CpsD/CapB family tyrosine-protein kinase, partial [Chloroflexi bacterium]|nr:CpsD/CapB family tyrosine-protein kinase [Chloroflexota bacterium]
MSRALAQMGKRVGIIDGDLRRAKIHKRFKDVKREPGRSNYLADITTDLNSIVHQTEIEGVSVIPSGPMPPNPAELLGSPKMTTLLKELDNYYDYIIIDSPPILLVADGSMLASQVDGAIIVADGTSTRSSSLRASLNTLRNTRVNILGVVINKLKRARFGYGYGYSYYYSYRGYYGTDESTNGSVNGNGHDKRFYQLPAHWVRSVVSRGPKA